MDSLEELQRERDYRRRIREGLSRSIHVHGIVQDLVKEGNTVEWTHRGYRYKVTIDKEKMK